MKTRVIARSIGFAVLALGGCTVRRTAPAASPATTYVVTPPGTTVVVSSQPWCQGAYLANAGTNFGNCSAAGVP